MSAGLFLTPDNGIIQIDENYRNLVLLEKATVTTAGGGSLTPYALYTPTTQTPTIVAVNGTAGAMILRSSATSGLNVFSARNGVVVNLYFFGMISTPGLSGAGLEVRNANGDVVFNTNYPPMRVVGMAKVPDLGRNGSLWDGASASITGLPTDGVYAGVLSHQRLGFTRDLDARKTYAEEDLVSVGSGTVSAGFTMTRTNGVNSGWEKNPAQTVGGYLMALDVTNY